MSSSVVNANSPGGQSQQMTSSSTAGTPPNTQPQSHAPVLNPPTLDGGTPSSNAGHWPPSGANGQCPPANYYGHPYPVPSGAYPGPGSGTASNADHGPPGQVQHVQQTYGMYPSHSHGSGASSMPPYSQPAHYHGASPPASMSQRPMMPYLPHHGGMANFSPGPGMPPMAGAHHRQPYMPMMHHPQQNSQVMGHHHPDAMSMGHMQNNPMVPMAPSFMSGYPRPYFDPGIPPSDNMHGGDAKSVMSKGEATPSNGHGIPPSPLSQPTINGSQQQQQRTIVPSPQQQQRAPIVQNGFNAAYHNGHQAQQLFNQNSRSSTPGIPDALTDDTSQQSTLSQNSAEYEGSVPASRLPAPQPSSNKNGKPPKSTESFNKLYEIDDNPARKVFLDKLLRFCDERKTPVGQCPTISRIPVDLFRLYTLVMERGGYVECSKAKHFKEISGKLGTGGTANSAYSLKKQYIRVILPYECYFDRGGIDPHTVITQTDPALMPKSRAAAAAKQQTKQGTSSPSGSASPTSRPPCSTTLSQSATSSSLPLSPTVSLDQDSRDSMSSMASSEGTTSHPLTNHQPMVSATAGPGGSQSGQLPPSSHPPPRTPTPTGAVSGPPSNHAPPTPASPPLTAHIQQRMPPAATGMPQTMPSLPPHMNGSHRQPNGDILRSSSTSPQPVHFDVQRNQLHQGTHMDRRATPSPNVSTASLGVQPDQFPHGLLQHPSDGVKHTDQSLGRSNSPCYSGPPVPYGDRHLPGANMLPNAPVQLSSSVPPPVRLDSLAPVRPLSSGSQTLPDSVVSNGATLISTINAATSLQTIVAAQKQSDEEFVASLPGGCLELSSIECGRKGDIKKSTASKRPLAGPHMLSRGDVQPVPGWRLVLSLKSGLAAECVWAVDVLNVLLHDDASVAYCTLANMPGLLDSLVELYLISFDKVFGLNSSTDSSDLNSTENASMSSKPAHCSTGNQPCGSDSPALDTEDWLLTSEGRKRSVRTMDSRLQHIVVPSLPESKRHRSCKDSRKEKLEDQRVNVCPVSSDIDCDMPAYRMLASPDEELECQLIVSLTTIFRNLSFVPGNDVELANHSTLVNILARLVKYGCPSGDTDNGEGRCTEWCYSMCHVMRENALVCLTNVAGHLELSRSRTAIHSQSLVYGLVDWLSSTSPHAVDPMDPLVLQTKSHGGNNVVSNCQASPQMLAIECLAKLCMYEVNVYLVAAVRPMTKLRAALKNLTRRLALVKSGCGEDSHVAREMAINILFYWSAVPDTGLAYEIARAEPGAISLLLSFIEQAEHNAMNVAHTRGVHALRDNPDSMGTSLDMLRRAASTVRHLSMHVDNASLLAKHESRLLSLVMSQILDQGVAAILSTVLFNVHKFTSQSEGKKEQQGQLPVAAASNDMRSVPSSQSMTGLKRKSFHECDTAVSLASGSGASSVRSSVDDDGILRDDDNVTECSQKSSGQGEFAHAVNVVTENAALPTDVVVPSKQNLDTLQDYSRQSISTQPVHNSTMQSTSPSTVPTKQTAVPQQSLVA